MEARRSWWFMAVVVLGALAAGAITGSLAGGATAVLVLRAPGLPAAPAGREPGAPALEPSLALPRQTLVLREESAVTEVANRAGPAVVTVINLQAGRRDPLGQGEQEAARGSGVVIDPRGFVVTNEHVVRGAKGLAVILASGQQRPARLVGTDTPFTDLAVVQVEGDSLPVAELGDSDALVLGQRVIAIGSALGDFRNTVTMGIVSGLHRTWKRDGQVMEDLVQTDAAINYGNSGGALLNLSGQVVGINTSVIRTTESGQLVEGIGFAIPSNTVRLVARQLIEKGKVARPFLGISHQLVTPGLAAFYDLPIDKGAYVLFITPDGPAALGGIQQHDIITKIGGLPLDAEHPLLNILMRFQPGQNVTITFYRGKEQREVTVALAERG